MVLLFIYMEDDAVVYLYKASTLSFPENISLEVKTKKIIVKVFKNNVLFLTRYVTLTLMSLDLCLLICKMGILMMLALFPPCICCKDKIRIMAVEVL